MKNNGTQNQLNSIEEKIEQLTKDVLQLKKPKSKNIWPEGMSAVLNVSDPSSYRMTDSPLDLGNLLGIVKNKKDITADLPSKLEFKPFLLSNVIALFDHLVTNEDRPFIEEVFKCVDLKTLATNSQRKVMLRYTDGSAIEADAMGTLWAYLINSLLCLNSKKQVSAFIQSFFISNGKFRGVYKSLTTPIRNLDHADFEGNSLVVAYELVRKNKKIVSISSDKVNGQPLSKFTSSQK